MKFSGTKTFAMKYSQGKQKSSKLLLKLGNKRLCGAKVLEAANSRSGRSGEVGGANHDDKLMYMKPCAKKYHYLANCMKFGSNSTF